MLGITLFSADGSTELSHVEPMAKGDEDTGVPTSVLSVGERRRWLLDLSEILPDALDPGHYQATVSFGPANLRTKVGSIALQFRAPLPEEQKTLDALAEEVQNRGTWGQWTSLPPLPGVDLQYPMGQPIHCVSIGSCGTFSSVQSNLRPFPLS